MIKCPKCQSWDTHVLDNRCACPDYQKRRRRECNWCGYKFHTREYIVDPENENMFL